MRAFLVCAVGLAMLLAVVLVVVPTAGQSDIIINNADTTWTNALAPSSGLSSMVANVATRVVQNAANANRNEKLVNPGAAMRALLDQVPAHVVLGEAQGNRIFALTDAPASLRTALGNSLLRTVVDQANGTRSQVLLYPKTLLNDQTPPVHKEAKLQRSQQGGIELVWMTDEFTTALVRYGVAPGVYTQEVSDPLFYKTHTLRLTDLQEGVTYYVKIVSSDLSGNVSESGEYALTIVVVINHKLYLPVIRR
jgi:hypothetical protein